MILLKVLRIEQLKLKRTIAGKMVVLAPLTVLILAFLMAANAPFSTIKRSGASKDWNALASLVLMLWAALMMPLYLALETAVVAGVDHAENQWKILLARPVPRWTWYVAKLVVVMAMLGASMLILLGGIVTAGLLLQKVQPELTFAGPVPWLSLIRQCAQIAALAAFALSIQHWISLRWRSFSIAIGSGVVAMIIGYVAAMTTFRDPDWPQYFPWALPMVPLSRHPQDADGLLVLSLVLATVVSIAGCLNFVRREVS